MMLNNFFLNNSSTHSGTFFCLFFSHNSNSNNSNSGYGYGYNGYGYGYGYNGYNANFF